MRATLSCSVMAPWAMQLEQISASLTCTSAPSPVRRSEDRRKVRNQGAALYRTHLRSVTRLPLRTIGPSIRNYRLRTTRILCTSNQALIVAKPRIQPRKILITTSAVAQPFRTHPSSHLAHLKQLRKTTEKYSRCNCRAVCLDRRKCLLLVVLLMLGLGR